jgi:CHAT domain-containing protein
VAYLPAASALAALTDLAPTAPKTPVVIGVHHTEEALAVADILRAEKHLIGESVAKEAVLDALQKGDLIHISANGFASQRQPDRSGWLLQSSWEVERYLEVAKKPDFALLPDEFADREKYEQLAQDAIISIADLESLHLHAMMVCASTCESGLVYTNIAEDPIGIIRSFLVGGVRNVVTALWKVDPKATQKLMEAYYQQLTHSPAGWGYKPQALRLAMLDIMREYPHPYFWAAFFLVGGADAGVAESQKGEKEC